LPRPIKGGARGRARPSCCAASARALHAQHHLQLAGTESSTAGRCANRGCGALLEQVATATNSPPRAEVDALLPVANRHRSAATAFNRRRSPLTSAAGQDSCRLPSSPPQVSISPASPRSPLPFPHLGRARGRSNRRRRRRPVTPCPPVSRGRRRGLSVLHLDPYPS
jgi:hypothetical protein